MPDPSELAKANHARNKVGSFALSMMQSRLDQDANVSNPAISDIAEGVKSKPDQIMTDEELIALADRLEAPAYWMSGSRYGHEGENDAPREAAAAIRALVAERGK